MHGLVADGDRWRIAIDSSASPRAPRARPLPALDACGFLDGQRKQSSPPPRKEVEFCKAYIETCLNRTRGIRCTRTSYGYKHDVEHWVEDRGSHEYISNGAFIQAALELGIETRPCEPPARDQRLLRTANQEDRSRAPLLAPDAVTTPNARSPSRRTHPPRWRRDTRTTPGPGPANLHWQ
ncbi:MAG: hypothetical protein QM767_08310 [Anaeromyxobacter sp.]